VAELEVSIREMKSRLQKVKAETDDCKKAGALDLGARQRDLPILKEAANRWTDNLFVIKKQLVDRYGMEPKQVDKEFDLGNIDYID